jgi:hypothetical protein
LNGKFPDRCEAAITLANVAGVFFLLADQMIRNVVTFLLGIVS